MLDELDELDMLCVFVFVFVLFSFMSGNKDEFQLLYQV